MTFYITVLCALLCGFTGGWLYRGKNRKRPLPPSGSALRPSGQPVWAHWSPEIGKAIGGRKDVW